MNRQQTIQLCLSIFGAFLLLQATNEAREAKNQADELESRIDQIELVSDDQTLQQKVNEAYASTQASADAITKFELAYNCKLLKAQKENEKKDPSKRDPRLESAQTLNISRLNNPPVDATSSDVLKAKSEITPATKKVLFIAGGLLLVAGVILFIRSRRK